MSLYQHEGLRLGPKQFRLLTFSSRLGGCHETGSEDATVVSCRLEVATLDTAPAFCALSYTWGASAAYGKFDGMTNAMDRPILCNGEVLLITENLEGFLRRAQDVPCLSSRWYWIDAICVNQQDLGERSSQVGFMADIYTSAAEVITWLGDEDEHTQLGFSLLEALCKSTPRLSQLDIRTLAAGKTDSNNTNGLLGSRETWMSAAKVFQRTYFSRVWVIQEIVLAQHVRVLCGRHGLGWDVFIQASHFFSKSRPTKSATADQIMVSKVYYQAPTSLRAAKRQLGEMQAQQQSPHECARMLLYSLLRSRSFASSDSRDKVFALLGLVHGYARARGRLTPVYDNAPHALATIYTNVAIQLLEDSEDLLLLSCVEGKAFQLPATGPLPSWVPDWSCGKLTGLRVTGYRRYAASGALTQRPIVDAAALTLGLRGIKLDYVAMVGESKGAVSGGAPFPRWLDILESMVVDHDAARGDQGEASVDAFWRTLLANTAGDPPGAIPTNSFLHWSFQSWFRTAVTVPGPAGWDAQGSRAMSLIDSTRASDIRQPESSRGEFGAIFSHARHLRLFRTSRGYLGLGSECLEKGDSVWIMPGSRVPLLLRRVGNPASNCQYQLVGGTYLHDYMDGEAVNPHLTGMTPGEFETSMERVVLE
ncbi:heterokaryon incompatibility protein-domain-containing protein [Schizothecium vesticola]|uniref:Heterokaryon incompatibility protein-domain-containing protein n=1 Tax=Schizothecium vesticola TaxID=314040 RepID=A0AA40F9H4_9PEZI|nr:heterokaryon incompatibility protein-domain-containing protein [Schizothecium vesticola]